MRFHFLILLIMHMGSACTWGNVVSHIGSEERCVNLGKNDKIQSIKNGRRELEKKMAESEKIIAAVTTCLAPCDVLR